MTLSKPKASLQRLFAVAIGATFLLAGSVAELDLAHAAQSKRPPQFVMLAFDGSLSNKSWQDTRAFAKDQKRQGRDVRFTYFISGVYYIMPQFKNNYTEPARGRGQSAIGWASPSEQDLRTRVAHTNAAFQEGHEIASHANAHFSGAAKWSENQWQLEFRQFHDLVFGVFANNRLSVQTLAPTGLAFSPGHITGFRAPLLEVSAGLWPTLRANGFTYDTSRTSKMGYIPELNQMGQWNFPLASIPIAGTGRRTLSMDYNFYVAQSAGKPDPKNSKLYEQQMYDSYINYFQASYNGTRAPLHIGHHFSLWNGGAYWRALSRFAEAVCGLPEVKCVTYQELVSHMGQLRRTELSDWKAGRFQGGTPIQMPLASGRPLDIDVAVTGWKADGSLDAHIKGSDLASLGPLELVASFNQTLLKGAPDRAEIRRLANRLANSRFSDKTAILSLRAINANGRDLASSSHRVDVKTGEVLWPRIEDQALLGDLPEAHDEANEDHRH